MKTTIKYTNKYDYESEDVIMNNCAEVAVKFADRVIDNEASLLYKKIMSFRKKYGTYPTTARIFNMCYKLNIDIIRSKTKTRNENGIIKGSGVDHPIVSIYDNIGNGELLYQDILIDDKDNPSDILSKSMDEFLDSLDERTKLVIKEKCENYTFKEIGERLKISGQRVDQIYKTGIAKLKEIISESK
jgi:RNA polymerase sigma factor (sigma-70 family)